MRVLPLLTKKLAFLYFLNIKYETTGISFKSFQKKYYSQRSWSEERQEESVCLTLNVNLELSRQYYRDFLPDRKNALDEAISAEELKRAVHNNFIEITDRGKHIKEKLENEEKEVEKFSYSATFSEFCELQEIVHQFEEKIVEVPGYGHGFFRFEGIGLAEKPRDEMINFHVKFSFVLRDAQSPRRSTFNHTDRFPVVELAVNFHLCEKHTAATVGKTSELISKIHETFKYVLEHIDQQAAVLEVTPGMTEEMLKIGYRLNSRIRLQKNFDGRVYQHDGNLFFSPRKSRQKAVAVEIEADLHPDQDGIKDELTKEAQKSSRYIVDKIPCSFFYKGRCAKGDGCSFVHDTEGIVGSMRYLGWRKAASSL